MNIKRLIFVITLMVIGCIPKKEYVKKWQVFAANETNASIIVSGSDSYCGNILMILPVRFAKDSVKCIKATEYFHEFEKKIDPDTIYIHNINDTTIVKFDIYDFLIYHRNDTSRENYQIKNLVFELNVLEEGNPSSVIYKFTIKDTLFSIMKKDYTMLEKFKEYYK